MEHEFVFKNAMQLVQVQNAVVVRIRTVVAEIQFNLLEHDDARWEGNNRHRLDTVERLMDFLKRSNADNFEYKELELEVQGMRRLFKEHYDIPF